MRLYVPALAVLLAAAGALAADRHKLDIDPESEDGILLQRIQQEPLVDRKLALLEKFVAQFPKATSMAWVYEQMLPIYVDAKRWDRVLATAQSLLALDPKDVDSAAAGLQAAEAQKDTALIARYAMLAWDAACHASKANKPADPDDAAEWAKQIEYANQVMAYSEFVLSSQAIAETDPHKKTDLIRALEQRNPHSKYLADVKKERRRAEEQNNPELALAAAEKGLASDPNNEDFLLRVAEHYMERDQDLTRVLNYSLRLLEILPKKPPPEGFTAESWEKKKEKYLGAANWMAGVIYGKQARYGLSDRYLRAALSYIQDDPQALAAAYFYLGYDNYAMAGELRDRGHAIEAARFSKLCAAINGPYQPLAQKNLELLRTEFNVE